MGEGHARLSAATVAVLAVSKAVWHLCVTALLWLGATSGAWAGDEAVANRRWAIAVYGGALTQHSFIESFTNPDPRWTTSYIAAVDVSYVVYRSQTLPLDIEIDATIAKRFGDDKQWDFGIVPMLRWKAFPWNDFVYTNFRLGLLGVSYVTGVSPWELHWAGNDEGSKVLNYLAVELDFKPDPDANLELFLRSHHRSGIFGLINDTHGGSTYMTMGLRWHF